MFRFLRHRLAPRHFENDLDEELQSHIGLRADDLVRAGLSRADAERQARREFGRPARYKEECREATTGFLFDVFLRDVRHSFTVLGKAPGFTVIAVLTLALAIGANAVVFGVINGLLLRPLDVPRADGLWGLQRQAHHGYLSYPNYADLRDRNRSFEGLAAYEFAQVGIDNDGNPVRAWANLVTGNYFDVLGIRAAYGRLLHPTDERGPNSAPYVVLSWHYWSSHFASDPSIVGRVVRINKHPYTVLGVTQREFHGTLLFFYPDLFLPMVNQEDFWGGSNLDRRGHASIFMAMGHLKPGVTPEQAAADLSSIGAWLERTYPNEVDDMSFTLVRPSLYGDLLGRPVRAFVTGLTLLTALILLAACANLGSLFASRAADRARESALRLALGASRLRILSQSLTEAAIISLAGGLLGLWISVQLLRLLAAWQPMPRIPMYVPVAPDANVYLAALAIAVVSGLLFAIIPVRLTLATDPYEIVKAGQSGSGGSHRLALREVLTVVQVAICAVLITASLVAVRGLGRSLHADFGFDPDHALLVSTEANMAGYGGARVLGLQKRMIDAASSLNGVQAVSTIDRPPVSAGWNLVDVFTDQTTDLRPANATALSLLYKVSPGYFDAARTPLVAGRAFTWHDDRSSPPVVVVNEYFARTMFGSVEGALGRYFKFQSGMRLQVVGVAVNGKYTTNIAEKPQLAVFRPQLQDPSAETWLVIRAGRDPLDLAPAVQRELRRLDADLPFAVFTWRATMEVAQFAPRMATASLGALGIIGALLATTGVFGMAAYSVSRRVREFGIRIALGARQSEIVRVALGRALKLLVIGSAVGILLGILAARVLAAIVYQATPRDPVVLAGVVVSMVLLGLVATWIPARRALSIDPWKLLREQ